jgi:methylenetetrahydrofolate reductase (NADPH)
MNLDDDVRGLMRADHGSAILARRPPLSGEVNVSFEFFPPADGKMEASLWASIQKLEPLNPVYVSVTYGAGGATRDRTHATIARILDETSLRPAAHLTCVGASRDEVDAVARRYLDQGVFHIVALRGDPPAGTGPYQPHLDGYAYASDLVAGLGRIGDFRISVAAYPEIHPGAASGGADLDNLKRKIDAGATQAITQFFFDEAVYLRFMDRVLAAGITVPVVPGILPVSNFARLVDFSKKCGASIPPWMAHLFDGLDGDPETHKLVAATVAAEQCRTLHANGVRDFHFYTMNRADLTLAVCRILGVRPKGRPGGASAAGEG